MHSPPTITSKTSDCSAAFSDVDESAGVVATSFSLTPVDRTFKLDRNQFNRSLSMLAVGLPCNSQLSATLEKLSDYQCSYQHVPKLTNTYRDSNGTLRKLILLQLPSDSVDTTLTDKLSELNVDLSTNATTMSPDSDPVPVEHFRKVADTVTSPGFLRLSIGYDNLSVDQTLAQLLPGHVQPVSGFTIMGHVAHFNLKPDALPYRHVIGQVILDKLPQVRTVIHKAAVIESDYRTFQLDLMAGDPEYVTHVRENGISFHLDISKVYWNSRLGTEHNRIVSLLTTYTSGYRSVTTTTGATSSVDGAQVMIPERVVVYDVFSGVGPFAVAAARRGCRVFANDLNPDAHHWLLHNVRVNQSKRRRLDNITCYNLDGREFIRRIVLPHYWDNCATETFDKVTVQEAGDDDKKVEETTVTNPHRFVVLMNLPALAPDFLDAFLHPQPPDEVLFSPGLPSPTVCQTSTTPLDVFCYCFLRKNMEDEASLKERMTTALGGHSWDHLTREVTLGGNEEPRLAKWNLRYVRNVAPFKNMYCAEFQLWPPWPSVAAAIGKQQVPSDDLGGVASKRSKLA